MARQHISGIYAFANNVRKGVYIGSASDIQRRLTAHLRKLRLNRHDCHPLQDAWNTDGADAFEFVILEYVNGEDLLTQHERIWMLRYPDRLYNIKRPTRRDASANARHAAYIGPKLRGRMLSAQWRANLSAAKKGQRNHSPEWLERLRQQMTGQTLPPTWCAAISNGKRGKKRPPFSEEWRKAMAAGHRGIKDSPEVRARKSEAARLAWTRRKAAA